MAPTVHAYTAAMRAATEGGRWARALDIWADLRSSGCQATGAKGHAYAAAISACAAGQQWQRAVALFDDMAGVAGIRPDVVSCTALVRLVNLGRTLNTSACVCAGHCAGICRRGGQGRGSGAMDAGDRPQAQCEFTEEI
eukprot:scaffold145425_cov23-Tisochrysis_lutea.AAC.1